MLRAGEERSMAVRTAHVLTPTRRRRRAPPAVCLLALLAVGLTACNRPSQEPPAAGQPNRQARVVAVQTLAPRLRDLTVDSPALGQRVKVRLLLHGCCDDYRSWTRSTDIQQLPALAGVLVVMPEAGQVGFYSDWYGGGQPGGRPSTWWSCASCWSAAGAPTTARPWRGCPWAVWGRWPTRPATLGCSERPPPSAASSTPATKAGRSPAPPSSRTSSARSARTHRLCGATRDSRLASGQRMTPTTSRPGCGGSTCSCRSATASPARSIRQHPTGRLARSSRPCAHRSSPSPGGSASLPSRSTSTPTAAAPTTGRTGSGNCTGRSRCCWALSGAGDPPGLPGGGGCGDHLVQGGPGGRQIGDGGIGDRDRLLRAAGATWREAASPARDPRARLPYGSWRSGATCSATLRAALISAW